ncbi:MULTISPECIES: (2Fe-2S)-binding protein [unclassified Collinsella]|uniref:(2Fe-2S)-binding protein n=1 Tax=unclassified Collinsella TaxID=2637548 RepID=UPI003F9269CC
MSRIVEHPILGAPSKGSRVVFTYDGVEMEGYEGEPIAMALKAAGVEVHRFTAKRHEPRGIFCAIGRCTDCVMVVDGKPNVRTCMTPLAAGMDVRTQDGVAPLDLDGPRAEALVAEAAASPAAVREDE